MTVPAPIALLHSMRSAIAGVMRSDEPSLRQRILTGSLWSIAGAAVASGCAMAANVISARLLGAESYGQLAIVLATTNLFTTLFSSGLGMTATRFVAEHRNTDSGRAGRVIGMSWMVSLAVGAAAAILMLLISPWLSREVLGVPALSGAVALGAVVMFFAALNGAQTGALSGLEAFNWNAFGNLARGIGTLVFVTAGAVVAQLSGALTGYVLVGAATAIFYQFAVRRSTRSAGIPISYKIERADLSVLWRFTLPVLITTFSFTPASWWSNVLLARTSGYGEAGVFNGMFQWQLFILFFSSAIANVGFPMLANVRSERNPAKYKRCLALNFLMTTAPAAVIAIPVAIAAPSIAGMYGAAFEDGAVALRWIALASVIAAANISVGHLLWSLDASRLAVLLALLRGVTLVAAAFALARFGAAGLAGAHVVMGVVQTVVTVPVVLWLLRREFNSSHRTALVHA